MCHFITAIINKDCALEDLNTLGKKYGITFQEVSNKYISAQLKPWQKYLLKISNHCDCGTALGAWKSKNPKEESFEKQTNELKKKGWSQTKIDNWIYNVKHTQQKNQRASADSKEKYEMDAKRWTEFILAIKESSVDYFGLLFHWYSGGVKTEQLKINDWRNFDVKNLGIEDILKMKEDVIYQLGKRKVLR